MNLWLVIGFEAAVMTAILILMLRKRSSARDVDEDSPADATAKKAVEIELPREERWE